MSQNENKMWYDYSFKEYVEDNVSTILCGYEDDEDYEDLPFDKLHSIFSNPIYWEDAFVHIFVNEIRQRINDDNWITKI